MYQKYIKLYEIFAEFGIKRGCLESNAVENCTLTHQCQYCQTENCNQHIVCKNCNSENNLECNQSIGTYQYNTVCSEDIHHCRNKITAEGYLIRSCNNPAEECNGEFCEKCSTSMCNAGEFPKNRLKCYQCELSAACSYIEVNNIQSRVCPLYRPEDACYSFANNESHMSRGCVSDSYPSNCTHENAKCISCQQNNCNNRNYKYISSLQCLQCSSLETENCWSLEESLEPMNCINDLYFNQEAQCYTQQINGHTYRGCVHDRLEEMGECNKENNCNMCQHENGCNNVKLEQFTCIQCQSDSNDKCSKYASQLKGKTCRNELGDENYCFWGKWSKYVIY